MKSINNFIIEKLQLNVQSKLKDWTIEDAKEGDIITFKDNDIYMVFIFYSIEEDDDHSKQIFAYTFYSVNNDGGWPTEKLGPAVLAIMNLDKNSKEKFYISTEDEKQLLFNYLKKNKLKWNPYKKEIKKI